MVKIIKKNKKISIGTWITLNDSSISEILAKNNFEWLCIDMEHSTIEEYSMKQHIIAIQAYGKRAFVRVAKNSSTYIKKALDAGADGIIVPMINSYREAKEAIEYTFYPPYGNRGVGLHRAQGYGSEFEKYYNKKSKEIELIVQIEHYKAIEDLEKIINLDKISGTFIGPFDLSSSLGMAGKWNDPKVKKVITKYEKIARNSNKLMGCHVIEPENSIVSEKIKQGYNFIAFSLDTMFLNTIVKNEMNKII
jgi:2-dehydro-3-deoxyglucarate aldolase